MREQVFRLCPLTQQGRAQVLREALSIDHAATAGGVVTVLKFCIKTQIFCATTALSTPVCAQIVVVSVCMACSLVVSRCIVCSVREQVFRLCPLVITDTTRSGTRVGGNTVFVHNQ